jgi:hypothetical protein
MPPACRRIFEAETRATRLSASSQTRRIGRQGASLADCSHLAEVSVGDLLPGGYKANFTLKATPGGASGPVATLEVLSGGSVIASRALSAGDFTSPGAYQTFPVEFGSEQPLTGLTLRIRHEGGHELWADEVELIYLYREPG